MSNEITNDQENNLTKLYVSVLQENGQPIYLVEDKEQYKALALASVPYIFLIDNINAELWKEQAFFKDIDNPLKDTSTPVIILCNENNKKASYIYKTLRAVNANVFMQDARRFEPITCKGAEATRQELARQYRACFSAGGTISEFKNVIKSSVNTPAIKTGFNKLDEVLDGGLYEGLYAIGAISSLGKTTFCLNIAEQIAEQGQDVIIFALEMSKASLIARSISRLTYMHYEQHPEKYKYSWCKTSRGITDGSRYAKYTDEEKELIKKSIDCYAKRIGEHLYIYETVGEFTANVIRDIVTKHMMFTGTRPVVIIDYLQLIQHPDKFVNGNDKIRTDFNLTALKQLSRDYKLPIIAISSFNRGGYSKPVALENFKESGGIDYTCDVIMGLQLSGVGGLDFDVNEAKAKNPREIELVFLKNRDAAVGDLIKYYYYPMFNHFEESSEDVKAIREYEKEQAELRKEKAKQNRAEQLKAEHLQLVNDVFKACEENGTALITEMVDFCGGKPTEKTLTKYIKETGDYKITGNKVTRL